MKHKQFLPLNLQLFAEEGTREQTPDNVQEAFNVDGLSDEQLAAIKEKFKLKDDKDVDSIIKNKRNRWQKELEEVKNQAELMASLSEEKRQEFLEKQKEDALTKREKELEEQINAFNRERLFVEKGKQLQEKGIPSVLANRILGDTAEEAIEDIEAFSKEWSIALETAVNERLKSSVDSPLSGDTKNTQTNPFAKETLNLTEQGRLFREDPERARMLQALANK